MREGEHMAIGSTDPEIIIAFRTFATHGTPTEYLAEVQRVMHKLPVSKNW